MDSTLPLIVRVCSSIGIAGSLASIYAYFNIPMFQIHLARAFLIIAIWYLLDHLAKLISSFAVTSNDTTFCTTAGCLVQFTALGSLLAMLFLVTELWLLVARRWTLAKVRGLDILFATLSVTLPLTSIGVLAIAKPFIDVDGSSPLFGPERLWCWISRNHVYSQLLALYLPMYLIILIILAAFYHMGRMIYDHSIARQPSKLEENQKRDPVMHFAKGATVYVGVFILCWIPGSSGRFYNMLTGKSSMVLLGVQAAFTGLRGLFHFVCYYYMAWSQRDRTAKVASTISIQVTDHADD